MSLWTGGMAGPHQQLLAGALALLCSPRCQGGLWGTPQLKEAVRSGQESPLPGPGKEPRTIPWGLCPGPISEP